MKYALTSLLLFFIGCNSPSNNVKPNNQASGFHNVSPTASEVQAFVGGGSYTEEMNGTFNPTIIRDSNKAGNPLGIYYTVVWKDGVWQVDDSGKDFIIEINLVVSNGKVVGAVIKQN